MKNFKEWINEGYYDPPDDPPSFIEENNAIVVEFEEKMDKEGMFDIIKDDKLKNDSDVFWKKLSDLDGETEFDEELGELYMKKHAKLFYTGGYDNDDGQPLVTQLYKSVRKEADDKYCATHPKPDTKKTALPYNVWWDKRRKFVNDALTRYVIDKNYKEWKDLYTVWVNYIHKNRGTIAAKKYGI